MVQHHRDLHRSFVGLLTGLASRGCIVIDSVVVNTKGISAGAPWLCSADGSCLIYLVHNMNLRNFLIASGDGMFSCFEPLWAFDYELWPSPIKINSSLDCIKLSIVLVYKALLKEMLGPRQAYVVRAQLQDRAFEPKLWLDRALSARSQEHSKRCNCRNFSHLKIFFASQQKKSWNLIHFWNLSTWDKFFNPTPKL